MAKYGTIISNVCKLLDKYPHLKGNDKEFVMMYWLECDNVRELNSDFLEKATSSESICRVKRRYLNTKESD